MDETSLVTTFAISFVIFICLFCLANCCCCCSRRWRDTNRRRRMQRLQNQQPQDINEPVVDSYRRAIERKLQEESQELRAKVVQVLFPEERIDNKAQQLEKDEEDPTASETTTTTTHHPSDETDDNDNDTACCSICLEELEQGDSILSGGLCHHVYHRDCVMIWVQQNDSCPVCRQPMYDEDTYRAVEREIINQKFMQV